MIKTINGYQLSPAFDLTKTPRIVEHKMTVLNNGNPNKDDLIKLTVEMSLSIKNCKE